MSVGFSTRNSKIKVSMSEPSKTARIIKVQRGPKKRIKREFRLSLYRNNFRCLEVPGSATVAMTGTTPIALAVIISIVALLVLVAFTCSQNRKLKKKLASLRRSAATPPTTNGDIATNDDDDGDETRNPPPAEQEPLKS